MSVGVMEDYVFLSSNLMVYYESRKANEKQSRHRHNKIHTGKIKLFLLSAVITHVGVSMM